MRATFSGTLQATKNRHVKMPASNQSERHCAVECRRPWERADRIASGIGRILCLKARFPHGMHAHDSVFGLEEMFESSETNLATRVGTPMPRFTR